jgi:hypothetical protein
MKSTIRAPPTCAGDWCWQGSRSSKRNYLTGPLADVTALKVRDTVPIKQYAVPVFETEILARTDVDGKSEKKNEQQ